MEGDYISLSQLNDFIFCPVSIYFHGLYGQTEKVLYQESVQINGTNAHKNVDEGKYSTKQSVLTALSVCSEQYGLYGKIDIYDEKSETLRERKKKIKQIYDGYIYQLYGQYYCMTEMGYSVKHLELYSMDDNKKYPISLPENDSCRRLEFDLLLKNMREFDISVYAQTNAEKCNHCIYEPVCDRSAKA